MVKTNHSDKWLGFQIEEQTEKSIHKFANCPLQVERAELKWILAMICIKYSVKYIKLSLLVFFLNWLVIMLTHIFVLLWGDACIP